MKTIDEFANHNSNPLTFDETTLRFFRDRLDDFSINIFRQVFHENKNDLGLIKTRLPNYLSRRKSYDAAFLTLEAIGFIEKNEDGARTPYFLTVRGIQLAQLLSNEKKMEGYTNE
ncbi:hypothetical protein [Gottfriedia solisilvae]|uniref:Uncharacterized protein n=1 Tax=Gottfriedia solisilvae TaxID=1516104 RepID=A0A8J3F0K4_9BACI|nr:hypothetical protein [Gottfriedia solisilvae]GGI18035.1 hypothetical protein GCM10007380_40920 [Gottfriedia solisilvae]